MFCLTAAQVIFEYLLTLDIIQTATINGAIC